MYFNIDVNNFQNDQIYIYIYKEDFGIMWTEKTFIWALWGPED